MNSLWRATSEPTDFAELRENAKTDILIIGGGIAGILTAYFLQRKGIDCMLVEKDRLCSGTTDGTTAKITFQHGLIYDKLVTSGGVDYARLYLKANQEAFRKFSQLCKEIDCDYQRKDNYVYSVSDKKKIEDELNALSKIGYGAKFVKNIPVPVDIEGAVCFPDQAQFHPLKFLLSLAKNLNIHEHTFVRDIVGTTAFTDLAKIDARKIIVCTHFPFINRHGSYFVKLYQHRTYMLALENAPDINGMYVDEDKKGLTFRNYNDMLIIGGASHRTGKKGGSWNDLRRFAQKYYPLTTEKFYWAAQDCMSLENMPYIGQYSKNTPDLYTATGFNKWGITGSMLAATLLCDLVTDTPNPYIQLFSPSRSILTPQLFVNGFEATKNMLTITPKRCSHLGCALKWNKQEHSWDCACHGSRFDSEGKILDNPANSDLKNKKK